MGAVGGGIWYGIKGARNSPRVRPPLICRIYILTRITYHVLSRENDSLVLFHQ